MYNGIVYFPKGHEYSTDAEEGLGRPFSVLGYLYWLFNDAISKNRLSVE
jgi:hypothetical protein